MNGTVWERPVSCSRMIQTDDDKNMTLQGHRVQQKKINMKNQQMDEMICLSNTQEKKILVY